MDDLLQRPTPLLRWRGALLKLESLLPGGGVEDRALGIFPQLPRGSQASLAATAGGALAAAGWARRHGVQLAVAVHGAISHEMREALRLWGARFEQLPSREAAMHRADLAELGDQLIEEAFGGEIGGEGRVRRRQGNPR